MSQLSQIFKDIANAIRSKSGSTNSITPLEMPQAINEIPSGGGAIAYAWHSTQGGTNTFTSFDVAPSNPESSKVLFATGDGVQIQPWTQAFDVYTYTKISDTEFTTDDGEGTIENFTRNPTDDVTYW